MTLNELMDDMSAVLGETVSDDMNLIRSVLIGVSRGNPASSVEQVKRINPTAYSFILGYVGDGDLPPYVSDDANITVTYGDMSKVPFSGTEGDIWFDKDTGSTYVYHIGDWVSVA